MNRGLNESFPLYKLWRLVVEWCHKMHLSSKWPKGVFTESLRLYG